MLAKAIGKSNIGEKKEKHKWNGLFENFFVLLLHVSTYFSYGYSWFFISSFHSGFVTFNMQFLFNHSWLHTNRNEKRRGRKTMHKY